VGMLAALLYEECGLCIRTVDMPDKQLLGPVLDYACTFSICDTRTHACKMQAVEQRDFKLAICDFVMVVTSKFRRIWNYNFPPRTPEHRPVR